MASVACRRGARSTTIHTTGRNTAKNGISSQCAGSMRPLSSAWPNTSRAITVSANRFVKNGRLSVYVTGTPTIDGVAITRNLFDQRTNTNCRGNCTWFSSVHVEVASGARNVTLASNSYIPTPARVEGAPAK